MLMTHRFSTHYKIILLAALAFLGTSCDSNDSDDLPANTIRAVIDGTPWEAPTASVSSGFLTIGGGRQSDRSFITIIIVDPAEGTFTLGPFQGLLPGSAFALYSPDADQSGIPTNVNDPNSYISTNGTLQISEFTDSVIRGTFSFEAERVGTQEVITVTDGRFHIALNR